MSFDNKLKYTEKNQKNKIKVTKVFGLWQNRLQKRFGASDSEKTLKFGVAVRGGLNL